MDVKCKKVGRMLIIVSFSPIVWLHVMGGDISNNIYIILMLR